jgi:hypothetical protein
MRELFLNYGMPFLVLGTLGGGLVYMLCSHALYTYLRENYSDILPPKLELYMHDPDAMGGFMHGIRYAAKSGGWKRIESNTWRRLFVFNNALGYFVGFCCVALCAAFLFWPSK